MKEALRIGCNAYSTLPDFAGAEVVESIVSEPIAGAHIVCAEGGATLTGKGLTLAGVAFRGNLAVAAEAQDVLLEDCLIDGNLTVLGTGIGLRNCRVSGAVTVKGATNTLLANVEAAAVTAAGAFNTVMVLSIATVVEAKGCRDLFVVDNKIGGLYAEGNDYFLGDGNMLLRAPVCRENGNINGDTLTDVDARLPVGANEALLPHVDKELFVGMPRRATVRAKGEELPLYAYILREAERKEAVIVPPGAYAVDMAATFRAEHSHTTVYAFGVYAEAVRPENATYRKHHLHISDVDTLTVRGLAVGYAHQSCGQVYVLEKLEDKRLHVVGGAGMWNAFCKSDPQLVNTGGIGIQRAGTFYALGDFSLVDTSAEKLEDGTMLVTCADDITYNTVQVGDILTCRLAGGAGTVIVQNSSRVTFKDFVLYGYAGAFAFHENRNLTGTTYYRVLDTTRTGEIIDEETYNRYRAYEERYGVSLEVSVDEKGRFRGSLPHIGSIDATHASFCAEGSQITSSLFENMCDDGTNQNSAHARLSALIDNGDGTVTVIYKGNLSEFSYGVQRENANFNRYCALFRPGDRAFIYTSAGQLVCDTPALSASEEYDSIPTNHPTIKGKETGRFTFKIAKEAINYAALDGFDLTDDDHAPDHKVLVDNMSRSSNYFRMDNMMVQGSRSRGLLIKASGGEIRNCTFRHIAKVAVAIVYEIFWGESGVSENLVIENNLIDHTGYSPNKSIYKHIPIDIMGLGGRSIEEDYLLYKNIRIAGNKFINRVTTQHPYAIYVQAARDVEIVDNDFDGEVVLGDAPAKAILLSGAMNLTLSGNKYPAACAGKPEVIVEGEHYKNIGGADIGNIPDKE